MTTQALKREYWPSYFDLVSTVTRGRQILIEMVGKDVGDQIEEDWSSFEGLSFDLKSNTLFIRTPSAEHSIFGPKSVMILEDFLIRTIGIRDHNGDLQIIHFRDPLLIEGH